MRTIDREKRAAKPSERKKEKEREREKKPTLRKKLEKSQSCSL